MSNLYVRIATEALGVHYGPDEAAERAQALYDKIRQAVDQTYPEESQESRDKATYANVVNVSVAMSFEDTPWWDSEDPKVRALRQLEVGVLLVDSVETFVRDVEASLGRSFGGTPEQAVLEISENRDQLIAELKGETYVPAFQIADLEKFIQQQMEQAKNIEVAGTEE